MRRGCPQNQFRRSVGKGNDVLGFAPPIVADFGGQLSTLRKCDEGGQRVAEDGLRV